MDTVPSGATIRVTTTPALDMRMRSTATGRASFTQRERCSR